MSDLTLNILIRAQGAAASATINAVADDAALAQQKLEQASIATAIAAEKLEQQTLATAIAEERLEQAGIATAVAQEKLEQSGIATDVSEERLEQQTLATSIAQEKLEATTVATAIAQEKLRASTAQADLQEKKLADQNMATATSMDETKAAGEGMAGGLVGGLLNVVMIAAMVVPALVGIGKKAISMDGDFQTAMLSNVAHAGLLKTQMDSVSASILKMSTEVGRSPTQLAEAMYPILSAFSGITNQSAKSSLALATLKLSFEAVAGTTVNGTDVANAAVGTFNSLGLATNNAATNTQRMTALMDIMDKTVQDGNMQWGSYKNVIAKLAVSIQGTSVKFTEASAALAVLTNGGMSAQKAQTYLSNMFTTMAIKTDALAKHAKSLGISFDEQKYSAMNLADKISYLNQVTGGNKQKILALLGGNATALKSFNALSIGAKGYAVDLNDLNNAHGALQASFDTASQGMQFAWSRVKAGLDAVMIALGSKLLPIVTWFINSAIIPLVTWLSNVVSGAGSLSDMFGHLGVNTQILQTIWSLLGVSFSYVKDIFLAVANALSGPVSGAMKGANSSIGSFINGGLALFRDALANINGVLFKLTSTAGPAVTSFLNSMKPAFTEISNIIGGVFASHMKMLGGQIQEISTWFQAKMLPAIREAMPGFKALAGVIMNTLVPGLLKLWAIGQGLIDKVMPMMNHAFEAAAPPMMRIYGIIAGGLALAIKYLVPYILQAAQAVVQFAEDIISRVLPSVIQFWNNISVGLDWLQANWKYIWPSLSVFLKGIWDGIVGIIKIVWAVISGMSKITLDVITGNWKQAWTDLKDMLAGIWDGIKQLFQGFIEQLQGVFGGLGTLLLGAVQGPMNRLGAWFSGIWNGIKTTAVTVWNGTINGIKSVVSTAVQWLGATWNKAVTTVVGWFTWLYNHNYYWKAMVDGITNAVKACVAWLQAAWASTVQWISDKWNQLAGFAKDAWQAVSSVFAGIWSNYIAGPLSRLWSSISGWWTTSQAQSSKASQSMWQKIASVFSSAWGMITGPLSSLWNNISGWFANIARQAVTWGGNLISGFASGILGAIGKVTSAVSGVMSKVSGFLGFHSPSKEGPGMTAHQWAPNLMKMFVQGLDNSIPLLHTAMARVMAQVGILSGTSGVGTHSSASGTNGLLTGPLGSGASPSGSSSDSGSNATVNITMHPTINVPQGTPKQQAQAIFVELDKLMAQEYRRQGINIPNSSGVAA